MPAPEGKPVQWTFHWPQAQTIREVEWTGNTFYYPVTKFELIFDGDEANKASFTTEPTNELQIFDVNPPRAGKTVTIRLADWLRLPDKRPVTGLDNIKLIAQRSPEFLAKVRPLLSTGGMMEYPKGEGGIVFCNLLFKDSEDVPLNAVRKRTIIATVLRNLKAPFAGGKTLVAGAQMTYTPVDLRDKANQYLDDRGWFGDKKRTMKDIPKGDQVFAGVPFQIYDFPTSPVPTVLMLKGNRVPNDLEEEIKGIPVGRKADALFFLQTARIDRRRNPRELKQGKLFEMLRYVVTYADGKTEDIPVLSEIDIDDYRQKEPTGLAGAQLGWSRPFDSSDQHATVYVKQWNNPRPDVEIKTIDMVYGKDKRGVPALIALTAAVRE
jgi:beta-galactosidase